MTAVSISFRISFSLNILRGIRQNYTKFYICIYIDKISVVIVAHNFLHICNRTMALDSRQNLVFADYLENKLTEFHQNLYIFILTKSKLGLIRLFFSSLFNNRVMSLDW